MQEEKNKKSKFNQTSLWFVFSGAILIASCCDDNKVTYFNNGITVKRNDTCGKTTFEYYDSKNKLIKSIVSNYSGINDGFKGYLKFHSSGKVELLSGDGYFESIGEDTLFVYQRILSYQRPELDSNVCRVSFPIEYEIEKNEERSEMNIKIKYD